MPDDGTTVDVDLGSWQTVNPTAVIGLTCAIAWLVSNAQLTVRLRWPDGDYQRRYCSEIGWVPALETFARWVGPAPAERGVRRMLPIVKVRNIRTNADVENLSADLFQHFDESPQLSGSLLQVANTALTEVAQNAVEHSLSSQGAFALAQMRRRKGLSTGRMRSFIEICVGDPGVGIASSLGEADEARAISRAFEEGVTRYDDSNRGFGLSWLRRDMLAPDRIAAVHSGQGYALRGPDVGDDDGGFTPRRFQGTLVSVWIPC